MCGRPRGGGGEVVLRVLGRGCHVGVGRGREVAEGRFVLEAVREVVKGDLGDEGEALARIGRRVWVRLRPEVEAGRCVAHGGEGARIAGDPVQAMAVSTSRALLGVLIYAVASVFSPLFLVRARAQWHLVLAHRLTSAAEAGAGLDRAVLGRQSRSRRDVGRTRLPACISPACFLELADTAL